MKYLESKIASQPPPSTYVIIIDAMFFMHLHTNLQCTFAGVDRYILGKIMDF